MMGRIDSRVDGNALAGMLAGTFVHDATVFEGLCGGCGSRMLLAETVVELDDRAAIVRCRTCTMTLFTVLDAEGDSRRLVFGALRELDVH